MPIEERPISEDKTRSCPTCRMEISVLAVKCRYCGDLVGRPKDETRVMTIEDLGGESEARYAPSSNVTEAMEAFRSEQVRAQQAQKEPERRGLLRRRVRGKQREEPEVDEDGALPELSRQSDALASLTSTDIPETTVPVRHKPSFARKLVHLLLFVAVIAGGYFGTMKVMEDRAATVPAPVVYHNRAPRLIEQGASPVKVLEAAVEALRHKDDAENQKYAAIARGMVLGQVRELLNVRVWERSSLQEALALANQAADIDANEQTQKLKMEVIEETIAYSIVLQGVDAEADPVRATFVLSDPRSLGDNTVSAVEGDLLLGRFRIKRILDRYVQAEDIKRDGRPVSINRTGLS